MPNRRSFLKNTLLTSTGLLILPVLSFEEKAPGEIAMDDLEDSFLKPPPSARPQAYWMWMNGHITRKGITLDLERMKKMGLSGAFIYNTGTGIPKGPVTYGSAQWTSLVIHAMQEARRLGLDLFLHNSPGFSSTGGSKVTPEMSMQQVVWTETIIESHGAVSVQLPQPKTKLGYYLDSMVVAHPSLAVEKHSMEKTLARITVNGREVPINILLDENIETGIELSPSEGAKAVLLLEFTEPFEARAITITRQREPSSSIYDDAYDHPPSFILESSADGISYRLVCTISMPLLRFLDAPGTQSFAAVKSRFFRLVASGKTTLTNLRLHGGPRLTGWPGKANFTDLVPLENEQEIDKDFIIAPDTVVDITSQLQKDGRLVWDAPAGNWTILRFGHTCIGTKTVATPDDAGGLEIDKFSIDAVNTYFRLYLNGLIEKLKPFDSFKGLLVDSSEIGKQNWTATFPSFFQQKRGYAIAAWMPALTGRVVQSIRSTEKFLWDVRDTQADMVATNYYGQFQKHCAFKGLRFYAQPNGDGVFDSLQVGQHLDVPMAEFWTRYMPGTINLVKQAVSMAHGYGNKIIAA
ncbi:MAG TPA: glycosyl hydrolase, partial [Chitinophagaceae bacterium]|nr:glycosyl hydrolase [Chitinophagaceae bacterium]